MPLRLLDHDVKISSTVANSDGIVHYAQVWLEEGSRSSHQGSVQGVPTLPLIALPTTSNIQVKDTNNVG